MYTNKQQNQWNTPPTPTPAAQPPRKRRRIFMWTFMIIQVVFLVWVVLGASSGAGSPDNCGTLSHETCNDAETAGTAIGVGIVIALWAATDIVVGISYGIYRLARR